MSKMTFKYRAKINAVTVHELFTCLKLSKDHFQVTDLKCQVSQHNTNVADFLGFDNRIQLKS